MTEDALPRRTAWAVAIAATFTMTVSQLDRTTLAVLAPTVTKELGISETGYGWLAAAFSISYLLVTPLAGSWLDRTGARRGLVVSVLVWSAIAALHSLMLGFGTLLALRVALGMAESPSYPGSAQTVQRVLAPGERARGFGLLFTGSSFGIMVAAPLATWLYAEAGWRVAFLGTAAIGLSWIPVWMLLTRRRDVRAKLDAAHSAPAPIASTQVWHQFVRQPDVVRTVVAVLAAAPLQGLAILWGAKYLDRTFHIRQEDVGHYLWLPAVAFDVGAVLFGDLSARQRRAGGAPPRLLFACGAALAACMALLPLATSAWTGIAILGVAMAGSACIYTLAASDILTRVPPSRVGLASGVLAASQSLVLIIVNPLIGESVSTSASYSPIAVSLGLWVIPGALFWLFWRRRPPSNLARAELVRRR